MVKIQNIEKLFYDITTYSYLTFPLVLLFAREKKGLPLILGIYGAIVFSYLYCFRYMGLGLEERLVMQSLYTPFEYLVFTYMFFATTSKRKKIILAILSACFILFLVWLVIFNPIELNSPFILDSIPIGIETILIFIYIFSFLYEQSKKDTSESIYNSSLFWISIGLLFYLGGSFFFNILVTQMSIDEFDNYWHYTYIAEILKNVLFVVALLKISAEKKKDLLPQARMPYLDIDMN